MKNISFFICLFLIFIFIILFVSLLSANSDNEEWVVPEDAHKKALQALKKLGSDRGARSIDYRVVSIIGISSGIMKRSERIKKALDALGAKETETKFQIDLAGDILFEFDKTEIRPQAEKILKKISDIINIYGALEVTILGHTDAKGNEEYNQKLSEKRAESVKNWLIKNGNVNPDTLKTIGYGESKPVAPNTHEDGSDNPEGRQKNRRVEILIEKK